MMPDVWPFGAIVSIVTGAHTRYFGIKSSKTPSTLTKNEKCNERRTNNTAARLCTAIRKLSHLCTQENG